MNTESDAALSVTRTERKRKLVLKDGESKCLTMEQRYAGTYRPSPSPGERSAYSSTRMAGGPDLSEGKDRDNSGSTGTLETVVVIRFEQTQLFVIDW